MGLVVTNEAGLEFFLEGVCVATDVEGDGVVQQPVKDGSSDDAITEDLAPRADALVAGQDHRPALIATADELEEEIGALPVDGQIAEMANGQADAHAQLDVQLRSSKPILV